MAAETADALSATDRADRVKAAARQMGFARAGVTTLAPVPHAHALDRWLAAGYAGTMRYMERQAECRKAPQFITRGATSAVVVMYNYASRASTPVPEAGRVAKYARGTDYHAGLAPALSRLAQYIRELGGPDSIAKPYVDAGPVPERELAQRAGLGWIGKNTMLIDPQRGSFTLLASVLTNVELAPDPPFAADRCGSCTRCLDACPTGAFPEPRVLDATRCISYLTIEYSGDIEPAMAGRMDDWMFGCDVCQEVCPWNQKFAQEGEDVILRLEAARGWVPLNAFEPLDDAAFDRLYGWTPMERAGLKGMRRNSAIAAANISRRNAHDEA